MTRRFPVAPVRDRLYLLARQNGDLRAVGRRYGLDDGFLRRLLQRREIRAAEADWLAVRLGCHPCEIWPQWFG